ncbi:MAG: zinc ribbon domain-containing protein, partial [Oscillospiraceae bacterium]
RFPNYALETEQDELQNEQLIVSELMQQCIEENSRVALDQEEYNKRFDSLTTRFDTAKARLEEVTATISDKQTRQAAIEDFLTSLKKQNTVVTEFTTDLWCSLVDFVTVHSKDDVRISFKDGTEIQS